MSKLKIIIAADSVMERMRIVEAVNKTGLGAVTHSASSMEIVHEWLDISEIDVLLVDIKLFHGNDRTEIEYLEEKYPGLDIILCNDEKDGLTLKEVSRLTAALFEMTHEREKNLQEEIQSRRADATEKRMDLILIAASTGGPTAVESVLKKLPKQNLPPILVVQHMPPDFTRIMADSLSRKYGINIHEAKEGETIKAGKILLAPGGVHMKVFDEAGNYGVHMENGPMVNGVKPAADVLFSSVAKVFQKKRILAVILTGMGNDGTKGLEEIRESCDLYTLTQDEASCIIYGMPKCVVEAGLSDEIVELARIPFRIEELLKSGGGK